jgi:hypothetical protein
MVTQATSPLDTRHSNSRIGKSTKNRNQDLAREQKYTQHNSQTFLAGRKRIQAFYDVSVHAFLQGEAIHTLWESSVKEEHHLYRRAESCRRSPASKPIATQIASWPVEYFSSRSCVVRRLFLAMRLTRLSRSLRTAWLRYTLNRLRIERWIPSQITLRKRLGRYLWPPLLHQFPDAESWPFDHERIRNNLLQLD